jgi:mRNA interferase MazF
VIERPYIPARNDLVWTVFDPALGREQRGRRPALVISATRMNQGTALLIVCPITSRIRPFPSSVVLPAGLPVSGEILLSAMRSIDLLARPIIPVGASIPRGTIEQVQAKLRMIFEL